MSFSDSEILGNLVAGQVSVGRGVYVGRGALIEASFISLGDCCFIGDGVRIRASRFEIGDYSKIQALSVGFGQRHLKIGNNCWIGGRCDLDCQGGLTIGNNVGIGSMSQIWTHIRHGDVVQGCRFESSRAVTISDDAWFVGSCLVSPVEVGKRSMALLGSVVTANMEADRTYAGVPAHDVTEKVGSQFEKLSTDEKRRRLQVMIDEFAILNPDARHFLRVGEISSSELQESEITWFDVGQRLYTKRFSEYEVSFLRTFSTAKFMPA